MEESGVLKLHEKYPFPSYPLKWNFSISWSHTGVTMEYLISFNLKRMNLV